MSNEYRDEFQPIMKYLISFIATLICFGIMLLLFKPVNSESLKYIGGGAITMGHIIGEAVDD